jgi:hypothetical protein
MKPPAWSRTCDRPLTRRLLCQLSYGGDELSDSESEQRPNARIGSAHSGRWKSRTPNLSVPLVFETSCRPTQRHPPFSGRAVDRTRATTVVAGYGLASRRITALPPFRSAKVDRLLDDMSILPARLPVSTLQTRFHLPGSRVLKLRNPQSHSKPSPVRAGVMSFTAPRTKYPNPAQEL